MTNANVDAVSKLRENRLEAGHNLKQAENAWSEIQNNSPMYRHWNLCIEREHSARVAYENAYYELSSNDQHDLERRWAAGEIQ